MTRLGIIEAEKPQQCDLCGTIAELRPYGPKGEKVCVDCGSKDKAAMVRGVSRLVLGKEIGDAEMRAVIRSLEGGG